MLAEAQSGPAPAAWRLRPYPRTGQYFRLVESPRLAPCGEHAHRSRGGGPSNAGGAAPSPPGGGPSAACWRNPVVARSGSPRGRVSRRACLPGRCERRLATKGQDGNAARCPNLGMAAGAASRLRLPSKPRFVALTSTGVGPSARPRILGPGRGLGSAPGASTMSCARTGGSLPCKWSRRFRTSPMLRLRPGSAPGGRRRVGWRRGAGG